MNANSHLVFQVTKRSERLAEIWAEVTWSQNIWMGVSVEDERVVHRIAVEQKLKLEIAHLSGSVVERGRLFLGDYSGVLAKGHAAWIPIAVLNRLRNYLVHAAVDAGSSGRKTEIAKGRKELPEI